MNTMERKGKLESKLLTAPCACGSREDYCIGSPPPPPRRIKHQLLGGHEASTTTPKKRNGTP